MKKVIILGLLVTLLCLFGGCGNPTDDHQVPDTDILSTEDMAENTLPEDRVLDKGGANGTDNVSILDYFQDDTSISSQTSDPYTDHYEESNGIVDDISQNASDLMDDISDGIHEMATPSQDVRTDTTGNVRGR